MQHLYFIRHGESEFNKADKWTGSTDSPLTELGHEQAKVTGKKLSELSITVDLIISSPLKRARSTAIHIADAINYPVSNIVFNENIIERNFGSLEGRKDLSTKAVYYGDESSIDQFDGAESLADLHKRAALFLEYLNSRPEKTIIVVGHGAFARALRRVINNEPMNVRGEALENAAAVKFI